jgi:hypothetical protein
MTNYQVLNSTGLIFGIMGVVLIFICGPPQPQLEEGMGVGLAEGTPIDDSGKTVKEFNDEVRVRRKRYNVVSRLGLGLIIIGFVLQLWATFV